MPNEQPQYASLHTGEHATAELTAAILLYGGQHHHFASIHSIIEDGPRSQIGPGKALSRSTLREWQRKLAGRAAVADHLLPANMIINAPNFMAWWTPAQVRSTPFTLTDSYAEQCPTLNQPCRVDIAYPALLIATNGSNLWCFALASNAHPGQDTPLFTAPLLNLFNNASLCWGNVKKPSFTGPGAIPEFERALFQSINTHPNPGMEACVNFKGGLMACTEHLAANPGTNFKKKWLKPYSQPQQLTLGRFIETALNNG